VEKFGEAVEDIRLCGFGRRDFGVLALADECVIRHVVGGAVVEKDGIV